MPVKFRAAGEGLGQSEYREQTTAEPLERVFYQA